VAARDVDDPPPAGSGGEDAPEQGRALWQREYAEQVARPREVRNRSGLEVQPLYTPRDLDPRRAGDRLAFPGQAPFTRGSYASMHRGRAWTQRQLTGLGTPAEYNARLREVLQAGATAVSLLPCNSVFRGYDADEVPPELLGTCGVVVNTWQHLDACLAGLDLGRTSIGLNDPLPFGLLACLLAVARRRGQSWDGLSGTSNQSDYLSHFVANHMFLRLSLEGSRRVLADQIEFCARRMPRWNPLSVVGQHMQQAGATPAEAMAFTLASALQYARDCQARGLDPDRFLPRFTFFFDISISFFEEVAKFRAGRRLWARLARERLGARDPRSWRMRFHAQTSGADLTRQQPLNNLARVAVQAMAGIFGGLQSLHTDAWDEALACPGGEPARLAVATQNMLREEAGLADVIDPLGGSYYVEALTDRMEDEIARTLDEIEAAGGMQRAVEKGLVQRRIGESAARVQARVESGEQVIVGVNAHRVPGDEKPPVRIERSDPEAMRRHVEELRRFKQQRSATAVGRALDELARAAGDPRANVFEASVAAVEADATHGEVCATLRRELGFGRPWLEP
jgi:methylmalonyl-CoA mutase N-terminal domain/subunit